MDRLRSLKKQPVEDDAATSRLHLRVHQDVAEALAVGKVRGEGTFSQQIERLVRAREAERASGA